MKSEWIELLSKPDLILWVKDAGLFSATLQGSGNTWVVFLSGPNVRETRIFRDFEKAKDFADRRLQALQVVR